MATAIRGTIFAGALALMSSFSAQAALITHNGYTLDTTTNIVTDGALEWLQWDETIGQTVAEALSAFSSLGFSVASNVQVANLFTDFFPQLSFTSDENDLSFFNSATFPATSTAFDNAPFFVSLFGQTAPIAGDLTSTAFYGLDADGDEGINTAAVGAGNPASSVRAVLLQQDIQFIQFSRLDAGIALVRAASTTPPVSVPEPSGFVLIVSALIALWLSQKRLRHRASFMA